MSELSGVNYEEVLEQGDSILVRVIASSSYRGFELSGLYCITKFKYEGLQTVRDIIDANDFFVTFDLKKRLSSRTGGHRASQVFGVCLGIFTKPKIFRFRSACRSVSLPRDTYSQRFYDHYLKNGEGKGRNRQFT